MQLYFAPLACSMATRIALYEANVEASFVEVDLKHKRTLEGDDFFAINPIGQVPVLRTDDGVLVSENGAVLQYVADAHRDANLAPAAGTMDRVRLQQWLSFIGTELHKGVFNPLLDPEGDDTTRSYARRKVAMRLSYLDKHLTGRAFLMDHFTVADAYLSTVLIWTVVTGIKLDDYPALQAYHRRMLERPSVKKAIGIERPLYLAEQARAAG
jgi:glutathione S-transferase